MGIDHGQGVKFKMTSKMAAIEYILYDSPKILSYWYNFSVLPRFWGSETPLKPFSIIYTRIFSLASNMAAGFLNSRQLAIIGAKGIALGPVVQKKCCH
jgi:hypothetical protein